MREGGQEQLQNLLLSEGVLQGDLNHKLTHGLDVRLLEERLRKFLHLLQELSLEGDKAFLERGRVAIDE